MIAHEREITRPRGPQIRQKLARSYVGLLASTGLVILAAATIAEILNTKRNQAEVEAQIQEKTLARGHDLVANHADVFPSLVRDTALTEIHRLVALTTSEDDVVYGVYSDATGKPWAYCSLEALCDASPDSDELTVVDSEVVARHLGLSSPIPQELRPGTRKTQVSGQEVQEFYHPVVVDGQPAGTLRYGISTSELSKALVSTREEHRRFLTMTLKSIALILFAALLTGFWVARRTARRITQPLLDLTAAAERLAAGDRTAKVNISSGDELETLGTTFNKMVADLRASYTELEAKNEELQREVAEKLRAQNARDEIQTRLLQSQKMEAFGQLAGGVAHDFNNILAVIIGNEEMARSELEAGGDAEKLRENLAEMEAAAQRGANLTRQLLTFARKEGERPEVVDLNPLLVEFEKLLRRILEESIHLKLQLAEDLKPVRVARGRIEQIVMNLCVNARDSMKGGGTITLSTEAVLVHEPLQTSTGILAPGEFVVLRAEDTGSGISDGELPRIFEPFYTTKGVGQGTGLGLATVLGIVEGAGGGIQVQTTVGGGSTFSVFLPAHRGKVESATAAGSERTPQSLGQWVLLCEDDVSVRKITEETLKSGGYLVVATDSGRQALARLPARPFHALVTDVVMPEMDGGALAAAARKLQPHLPVLFLSGYTAGILTSHGVSETEVNFLRKPFAKNELLQALGRLIATAAAAGDRPAKSTP